MHVLALLLFTVSVVTGSSNSRNVGGNDTEEVILDDNDAPDSKYPYQVLIKNESFALCEGSIISNRYILTAAHCIYGVNSTSISIIAGTNYLNKGGVIYAAERLIWPSTYYRGGLLDDIGLIRVNRDINYTAKIQPVALATRDIVSLGDIAFMAGWREINETEIEVPIQLEEFMVAVMSQSDCQLKYLTELKNSICAYSLKGKGPCQSDTGSPLVVEDVQIGVVSFRAPCVFNYPDIYTKVHAYRSWIAEITGIPNAGNHVDLNRWIFLLLVILIIIIFLFVIVKMLVFW